jgi:hypothetical protein
MALDGGLGNLAGAGRAGSETEMPKQAGPIFAAALLEPRRALLRSYLGKAFMNVDNQHANLELDRLKAWMQGSDGMALFCFGETARESHCGSSA